MLNPTIAEALSPFAPPGSACVTGARELAVRRIVRNAGFALGLSRAAIEAAQKRAVRLLAGGASAHRACDAALREALAQRRDSRDLPPAA